MKLLAIDTATEQCSVAMLAGRTLVTRVTPTARSHADLILPMVDDVLRESALTLKDMDALAFGRGPGSFTGVRIAVGVIQGLALSCDKPVIGISDLAAVAQQAASTQCLTNGAYVLVCMDARMQEVYWARYRVTEGGLVELVGEERVANPGDVHGSATVGVGTGWRAYPEMRARFPDLRIDDALLPRAQDIARLAELAWVSGHAVTAAQAQPVYLRDNVVAER